jgi:hypothetical protein
MMKTKPQARFSDYDTAFAFLKDMLTMTLKKQVIQQHLFHFERYLNAVVQMKGGYPAEEIPPPRIASDKINEEVEEQKNQSNNVNNNRTQPERAPSAPKPTTVAASSSSPPSPPSPTHTENKNREEEELELENLTINSLKKEPEITEVDLTNAGFKNVPLSQLLAIRRRAPDDPLVKKPQASGMEDTRRDRGRSPHPANELFSKLRDQAQYGEVSSRRPSILDDPHHQVYPSRGSGY